MQIFTLNYALWQLTLLSASGNTQHDVQLRILSAIFFVENENIFNRNASHQSNGSHIITQHRQSKYFHLFSPVFRYG